MTKKLLLACAIIVPAYLSDASAAERELGSEVASVSYTITGYAGFEDPTDASGRGRVSVQQTQVAAPLVYAPIQNASVAAGAMAGWTRLDFKDHPELDSEDLYGAAVFVAADQTFETGWGWSAMVMPGFYTDFRKGRTGRSKTAWYGMANYSVNARLKLTLGAAYDTAFGDPAIYPVGGAIWKIRDDLTLNLVLPSPALYWAPNDNYGLFARIQPAGARWIVDDDETGEQVFLIESWRAGAGIERRLTGNFWIRLSGGMDFERHYEARSGDRTLLDAGADDTWLMCVEIVVY